MPLKSKAQLRMFEARAHQNPRKARRGNGPSATVARKFIADSKGQDFSKLPERIGEK